MEENKFSLEELSKNEDFKLLNKILWSYYTNSRAKNEELEKIIDLINYEINRKLNIEESSKIKYLIFEKDYNAQRRAWFEDFVFDIFQFIQNLKRK